MVDGHNEGDEVSGSSEGCEGLEVAEDPAEGAGTAKRTIRALRALTIHRVLIGLGNLRILRPLTMPLVAVQASQIDMAPSCRMALQNQHGHR